MENKFLSLRPVRAVRMLGTYSDNDIIAACQQLQSQNSLITVDNLLDVLSKQALPADDQIHSSRTTKHLHQKHTEVHNSRNTSGNDALSHSLEREMENNFLSLRPVCAVKMLGIYSNNDIIAACQQLQSQEVPITVDNLLDALQKNVLSADDQTQSSRNTKHSRSNSGNDTSLSQSDDENAAIANTRNPTSTVEVLRKGNNETRSLRMCVICNSIKADRILHPCRHLIVCKECYVRSRLTKCLRCKNAVHGFEDVGEHGEGSAG